MLRRQIARHCLILLGYLGLSIVVTYPLILHVTTQALGENAFDRNQNIWNLWWVKVALLDGPTWPFHTALLLAPRGADLYFHALNLPSGVLALPVELLLGPVPAYNFTVLTGLMLSGYAGFRLVSYLTGQIPAGLVGGVIIGFNPLTHAMLQGLINLTSLGWLVLCIEFYLRAWATGSRRSSVLTGIFFALAVLMVGYFELHLVLFFAAHLGGQLWAARRSGVPAARAVLHRTGQVLGWAGGTAALVLAPYLLGAALSLQKDQILLWTPLDATRRLLNSADVLSLIVPSRDHWLLGAQAPWWSMLASSVPTHTYIGFVALALAGLGARGRPRPMGTGLWVALAVVGIVLALGPLLRINGQQTFAGLMIPLPLAGLALLPPFSVVRAPERFMTLTYLALGVLAGYGVRRLLAWLPPPRHWLALGGVFLLLVLDMPLHLRYITALPIPASVAALAQAPDPGAVLELPLTEHGRVDAPRMYYQTAHGRPITSAYLSRFVGDPYGETCSPFRPFKVETELPAGILSPTLGSLLSPAVLAGQGVSFVAVYKQGYTSTAILTDLPADQLAAWQALGARVGTVLADDATATIYRVGPATGAPPLAFQLGSGWHPLETSYGQPFRWINGAQADFCVFSPVAGQAALRFPAASFALTRHLQLWLGDQQVFTAAVPADGVLHLLQTPTLAWPAGPALVRLIVPEGSARPSDLGHSSDTRSLSLGLGPIQLLPTER